MPLHDKVEAIKNRVVPITKKKRLSSFIGLINYYRDIWQHPFKVNQVLLLNKPNGIDVKNIRRHLIQ